LAVPLEKLVLLALPGGQEARKEKRSITGGVTHIYSI
jgi:hypothetical protein